MAQSPRNEDGEEEPMVAEKRSLCVPFCVRPGPRRNPNKNTLPLWCERSPCTRSCDKPNVLCEADEIQKATYKEVGRGQGQYDLVAKYNFVGTGQGSFVKQSRKPWLSLQSLRGFTGDCSQCGRLIPLTSVCATVLALTGLFGIIFLLSSSNSSNGGSAATRVVSVATAMPQGSSNRGVEKEPFFCGPSDLPFEETFNIGNGWTEDRQTWCCKHHGRGCTTTSTTLPYDCHASLVDWQAGWARTKKHWCCAHESVGCQPTTTDAYDCTGNAVGWDFGKRYWCCWNRNAGCNKDTGRTFDQGAPTSPTDVQGVIRKFEVGP